MNQTTPSFFARFRNVGVMAVLMALVIGAAVFTPHHTFIGEANLKTLLAVGSEFGIVALGVGVLMIAGEFDLSVGSVLALCGFIFAWLTGVGINPFVTALITMACGAVIGTIHGLITVKANVVSFIATLGGLLTWRGLAEILSGGTMLNVALDEHSLFVQVFTGQVGGAVPAQCVWFVFFAVVLYLMLNRGRFGNWIYATGDNAQAARAMAIKTDMVKIACFVLVGFLVAFAGVIQTTRSTAFSAHMATGWELNAVAAAVVGGTSLRGGRGSMVGIFLGALVIIVIDNMISQARIAYEWTYVAFGLVILGSVLLDLAIEKRVQRSATA
jgi:simple sugar transport system permease protein